MRTLSVRLPEALHTKTKELAAREGISMNQLINMAVTEKISASMTATYNKGSETPIEEHLFEEIMYSVQDSDP